MPSLLVLIALVCTVALPGREGTDLVAPRPAEGDVVTLARRAKSLSERGAPLEAWQLLIEGLGRYAQDPRADGSDGSRRAAAAEVAARLLHRIVQSLGVWPETATALERLAPYGPTVPHDVVAVLERCRADALRRTGRADEGRYVTDRLGVITDYLLIGPFDNERGTGFDVSYAPEQGYRGTDPIPGKSRDVAWRRIAVIDHPLGRLALHETLRPRTQAVAYLATTLIAPEGMHVALRLGTTGPVKVFLDGEQRFVRDVERPQRFDQDVVPLALREGPNELLLKVAVEDGPWSLETRLTELDGRPVVRVAVASNEVFAAASQTDAGGPRPVRGAAAPLSGEVLESLALAGDIEAARLLSLRHLLVHSDDFVDRGARRAAERVLELQPAETPAPLAAFDHYLAAQVADPLRASIHELEVNRRLSALKRVLALDPDHTAALVDLADFAMGENVMPERADTLTARALQAAPNGWRALMARASFLRARGRLAESDQVQLRAEATEEAGYRALGQLLRAARHARYGDVDMQLATLEAAFARDMGDGSVVDALVRHHIDRGNDSRAMGVTDFSLRARPWAVDRLLASARLLEHGDYEPRAHVYSHKALAICPDRPDVHRALARQAERDGDYEATLHHLNEAARLDPGDDPVRRRLALLTHSDPSGFEQPYRWDALDYLDMAAAAPPSGDANEALEVLERTVVVRVQPDGTEHRYEHVLFHVLHQGGVKQLDTYGIAAPPGADVQIDNVRVVHPDGSYERAPAGRPRSGSRFFDLPALAPGDLVDVEYRVDERRPDVFGEYFGMRHAFQPARPDPLVPTRRSELIVLSPADVPLYVATRNAERVVASESVDAQGLRVRRWVATDLPRPPIETAMPRPPEIVPVVDVTTYPDWNAFAGWWWSLIEKEFVTTPEMRAKVAEVTQGLATEDERVAAIARFVGQEIRYNAWAFGTHGYEPFSAATIFERRFGDCKDKSILLRQLLAEIGVEAVPVLIKAEAYRSDEPLDAAMVGHFNHCIAYVQPTDERPGYYLDATADLNPIEYLRHDDQGARVLHVTPDGGELRQITYAAPSENALRRSYTVALDPAGHADVDFLDDSTGQYGVRLRRRYGGEQGDLAVNLAAELRDAFGNVTMESAETSDLVDITEPAWIRARFRAAGMWPSTGDERTLRVGFDDLGLEGLATELPEERRFDLVLDRPLAYETTIRWVLPPGFRVADVPADVLIETPDLVRYEQTVRLTDAGVDVRRRFEIAVQRVERERYADFRNALQAVRREEDRILVLVPELEFNTDAEPDGAEPDGAEPDGAEPDSVGAGTGDPR